MEKLRIFLADWQVLFREGIHFILSGEEDMEVIGEDVENEKALTFIEANSPNVAILNADHGRPTGVEVTRRIKQNLPEVSVILMMDSDNEDQLFSVIKSGASACMTKDVDPEVVIDTIRQTAQGHQPIRETLLRPEIASRVAGEFEAFSSFGEEVGNLLAHLTQRESETLHHIIEGKAREGLAEATGISEETITRQLEAILRKLVANEQKRMLLEAAQRSLSAAAGSGYNAKQTAEYITKEEFEAFKESLKARFKSLSGEIS